MASLALRLVNAICLLDQYMNVLWDMGSYLLPAVPQDLRASLIQTIEDGRDMAKYVIRTGLDTTDCL